LTPRDDDYFLRRAGEGEKQVFFALNSPGCEDWPFEFARVVKEIGLVPIFYAGVGRDIVPKAGESGTLNDEILDDFYFSKITVLYFGPHKPGRDYEDHWVLSELPGVLARGRQPIVYASPSYPGEILRKFGLDRAPTTITGLAEFVLKLRQDLQNVIQG